MRKKAASPAARRKAVATMKRTLAAKRAAEVLWPANRVSRVPIEAIPPRKATPTKPTATGPSYRLIAKLIVHVARALGGGE
jgi:hypothetical protein